MYKKRPKGWLKHADFMLIEVILFQVAFVMACMIRHGMVNPYSSILYRNTAIAAFFIQIIVFVGFNTFRSILRRGYLQELKSVVKTALLVMFFLTFYLFAIQMGEDFSRFVIIVCGGFYGILVYTARTIWKKHLLYKFASNKGNISVVAITTKKYAKAIVANLSTAAYANHRLTGVILYDGEGEQEVDGIPVVATKKDMKEYLCRNWVDEVYLQLSEYPEEQSELIDVVFTMGMTAHLSVGNTFDFTSGSRYLQKIGNSMVISMTNNVMSEEQVIMKRALDIFGALVGLFFTGLIALIIGPIIYFASPGPIIFSQNRIGRNGKVFRLYKFRSMYMDAEERKKELMAQNEVEDGMMFKIENDPRIIGSEKGPGKGIGNFIRKTSLDEFPQFFNVLMGDMSLVGTRPPTVDEWEKYSYHHRSRLSVKPGITGLWQVSGRSDIQDFEEVVKLDLEYAENCSAGYDLKIVIKTVLVIFLGKGAR